MDNTPPLGQAKASIALLALLAVLGGCASSDGLSTHAHIFSPSTSDKALANAGTKYARTWPRSDWWHTFGDAQLDALIEESLRDNPDLAAADARIRQAGALAMNADALRAPSVKAIASVQGVHVPGKVLSPTSEDMYFTPWILGLNGSYNPDLWGGERAAWEAALDQQRAAEVDAHTARLKLSADVARTYVRLAYAYQINDLTQKNAERAQHLLALTTQRVSAGIDEITRQREAEALAAASRQVAAQSFHAIQNGRIALAVLTGKGPERAAEITRPQALQPVALTVPDNLPADLLGRRPDIVAARWRVEAASRDIDASKASFYPSFNLSAAIGLVSLHHDELLSLRSRYYSVAPAISLPLFDGGRLRANLAGSNAEYDLAVAQYNKTLIGALNEVALRIETAQTLADEDAAQQQSLDAARKAWELAMQRHRHGISSLIEALNAEQAALAAESRLADIHTQQADNAVQLIRSLGGGYGSEATGAPLFATQDKTGRVSP